MAKNNNLTDFLTNTANAIRYAKTNSETGTVINPQNFEAQIKSLNTFDADAAAGDILSGKTAYVDGVKVTGTIPSQAAKTITPSTSAQTAIAAGTYATGAVTVAGDVDLIAKNIRKGVNIFNVAGTYDGLVGENLRGKTVLFYFANVDSPSSMPDGYHFYVDSDNHVSAFEVNPGYYYWDDVYIGGVSYSRDSYEPMERMFTYTFPNDKDYIVTAYDNRYFTATIVQGINIPIGTDVPSVTNLKGKTLTFRSILDATYSSSGDAVTVFKVSNSDYIEIDTMNGYYQGYGLFSDIYDNSSFSGVTVTFPNTQDYIISVDKGFVAYS